MSASSRMAAVMSICTISKEGPATQPLYDQATAILSLTARFPMHANASTLPLAVPPLPTTQLSRLSLVSALETSQVFNSNPALPHASRIQRQLSKSEVFEQDH